MFRGNSTSNILCSYLKSKLHQKVVGSTKRLSVSKKLKTALNTILLNHEVTLLFRRLTLRYKWKTIWLWQLILKNVLIVLFLEFCTTSWATSWSAKTSRIDFELQPDWEETWRPAQRFSNVNSLKQSPEPMTRAWLWKIIQWRRKKNNDCLMK